MLLIKKYSYKKCQLIDIHCSVIELILRLYTRDLSKGYKYIKIIAHLHKEE